MSQNGENEETDLNDATFVESSSDEEEEEEIDEAITNDKDDIYSKYIPKLDSSLSIKDKIKWTAKLQDHNYFVDKPIDCIKKVNCIIRPKRLMPKSFLNKFKSPLSPLSHAHIQSRILL